MKKFDMKTLLDGIKIFQKDQWEVCKHYYRGHGKQVPGMLVVAVDPTDASKSYIRNKERYFKEVGIPFKVLDMGVKNPDAIRAAIGTAAKNEIGWDSMYNLGTETEPIEVYPTIGGIIVQLPLPNEISGSESYIIDRIPHSADHYLDIDGLCNVTLADIMDPKSVDHFTCLPCTPKGVMVIMDRYLHPEKSISELLLHSYNWNEMLRGKKVVIVGRGKLVGKPLAVMCINAGATVSVCNSSTPVNEIITLTRDADIVVFATGQIERFNEDYCSVNKPQLIIDCGIGYNSEGKLRGDFKPNENFNFDITYTSVPGGVGPMTVSMLCQNFLENIVDMSHDDIGDE